MKATRLYIRLYILMGLLLSSVIHAADIKISGSVKDAITNNAIENATVQLLNADSVLVSGGITDSLGCFELEKTFSGDMYLVVSFVGYESSVMSIENATVKDIAVGIIYLEKAETQLSEVVVSATPIIYKVNKQIIYPNKYQVESTLSSLELLNKLMLPDLSVDIIQNTIKSYKNGSVLLQINGIEASIEDVLAIPSKQVMNIEYIDRPGSRYGSDVASVINFITKKYTNGLSGGINIKDAVLMDNGNNMVFLRYNNKLSEFSLNYNFSFERYGKSFSDIYQEMILPDLSSRVLEKNGEENTPYKKQVHNLSVAYNLTRPDKYVFNVKLNALHTNIPHYVNEQCISEVNKADIVSYTGIRDKSTSPSVNIYFQYNLPKAQTLTADVTGTYISSKYSRSYDEFVNDNSVLGSPLAYDVTGEKYSVISEFIYEKAFGDEYLLSAGLNYEQSYVDNKYIGSTGDVKTAMNNSEVYLYADFYGGLGKLQYVLGLGVSRQYFKENANKYNFYTFRPAIYLMYPLSDKMDLQYSFLINPILPSLDRLSDVTQWQNEYEAIVGNPQLKPYRGYMNNLSLNYATKRLRLSASGYVQCSPKPIMADLVERIDLADNGYYYRFAYANQKRYTHIQGKLNVYVQLIENLLSFSALGGINHYINQGNDYEHRFTSLFGRAQIDASFNKFNVSVSADSPIKSMFAETIIQSPASMTAAVDYRLSQQMKLGLGIMNPFFKYGNKRGEKLNSAVMKKETWNYVQDLRSVVFVTFSYNFNIGRKSVNKQVNSYNSDTETGIVK